MNDTIRIRVNGQEHTLPVGASVADLIARLELTPPRVAVEVNTQLVKRTTYAETRLHDGDQVEVVTLVGGG